MCFIVHLGTLASYFDFFPNHPVKYCHKSFLPYFQLRISRIMILHRLLELLRHIVQVLAHLRLLSIRQLNELHPLVLRRLNTRLQLPLQIELLTHRRLVRGQILPYLLVIRD